MKAVLNKFSTFFLQGGLKETVMRFPVSSICALTLFIISVITNLNLIAPEEPFMRAIASVIVGYFWFGGMRLVGESMGWSRAREMARAFLVYVPFVALMALAEDFGQYLLFIIPALLLFLMISPYMATRFKSENDLSFWLFNRYLWVGVLLSFLAILVMTGGLHAAFASIEALFKVNLSHKVMSNIWSFSAFLVGPVYALSLVPKQFVYEDKNECEQTPGLMFMLNWILAPLILIYFLILYAYFIKLLVIQELPLGVLAYMVTGFAGAGIATYLIGWPVREKTGALLQKIYQYFFPALIVPVILQILAIGERIYTFGVTEQRFMVALSAVWLAVLVVLFTERKNTSIKIMPYLLMMLLALASFGPWGAVGLSGISQYNRLEKLLTQYEILQDGKVVKTEADVPFEDRKSISSKVQYFYDTDREERLRAWFPDKDDEAWKKLYASNLVEEMGLQYVNKYQHANNDDRFNYSARNSYRAALDVRGYDFVVSNLHAYPRKKNVNVKSDTIPADEQNGLPEISWSVSEDGRLTITIAGRGDVVFDLAKYVEEKRAENQDEAQDEMVLDGFASGLKLRLVMTHLSGQIENDDIKVGSVSFSMLLDL